MKRAFIKTFATTDGVKLQARNGDKGVTIELDPGQADELVQRLLHCLSEHKVRKAVQP